MLKKDSILKIDTKKASSEGDASSAPVICPHCGYLTAVLIEKLSILRECITCHNSYIPKDAIEDEKRKREK